jgi:hypothetical protein
VTNTIPADLPPLARVVADWAATALAAEIYIFGSRVRGDHHSASDVDLYIHYLGQIDDGTLAWHARHQRTSYADLIPLLPGPLGENGHSTLEPDDEEMVRKVLSAPVVYSDRNVRCVTLPPKPISARHTLPADFGQGK